jgi:peptide/nickel transport system substrate-binding protein
LFFEDWTLDRDIWPFLGGFVPDEYYVGALADTWEMTDAQTMIVHLREGVYWQDMPPVNGREFTADDVVYQYNRMFGLGGGFTEFSPFWFTQAGYIAEVTATDAHTVVFSFTAASALNPARLFAPGQYNWIAPREAVEMSEESQITDWENAPGTGAWMVTDFVSGTSVTYSANPNYWGYDERHPENKLPYADTLVLLLIPDAATAIAGMRSGQIDFMSDVSSWQQVASLAETNPEILQAKFPAAGATLDFRCDTAPFTDIRVRKALQMAIDREEIAQSYYGGTVDGIPAGLVTPAYQGWYTPYDEWPAELQAEYSYDPDTAMALLAEAAADGVFEPNDLGGFDTNIVAASSGPGSDLQLLQIIQDMLLDIGVDMEINAMDASTFSSFCMAGEHDQMTYSSKTGVTFEPWISLDYRSRIPTNYSFNKDPVYDAMIAGFATITDLAELKQAVVEADMYALAAHWGLQVFPIATYNLYQSYLKGYSGEYTMRAYQLYSRWWIDQDLKSSLGR